jgi:hypothetical protein
METLTLPKGKENQIRRIEGVSQIVPFNRTAVEELSEENLQANETIKAITQPDSIDAIANTLTGTFSINLSEGTEGKDHLAKAGNMARRFGGWAQRFINDRFNIQNKNLVSGRDVTAVWKEAIKADSSVTSLQTENGNLSGIEAIISCETEEQKQALIKSSFDNLCAKAITDDTFLKGLTQMGGAWTRDVLKKELEQYSAGGNQNLESFVALSRALEIFKKGFEHVKGQHKLLDFARKAGRLDKSVETLQKTQVEGAEGTGLTETAGDLRGFYAPIYKDKEGNWKFSPRGLFKGLTSLVQRSVFTPITAGLPWFAPTLLSAGGMAQDGEKSLVNLIQSVINNPQIPENQKEGYVRGLLLKGLDESVYKQRDKYNWGNLPKALIGDFIASGTLATGSRVSVEAGTYQKALEIAEGYFASKSKEISATTTEGIMALAQGAAEAEGYNPTDQELENYVANWSQNSNLWSNLDTTWERKMKSVAFNAGSMFVQGRIMNFAGQAAMQAGSLADQSLLGGNIGASFNLIRGNTSTEFNLQNGDKITTGHSTEQLAKPGQQTIRFGEYQVITSNPENYAGGKLPDTVLQEISAKAPSVSLNSNQLSISNGVLSVKGEDFGLAGNGTKIGDTFGFGGFYLNKGSSGEILNINGNLVMYQGVSPDGKTALFTEVGNPNARITQSYLMHEVGEEEGGGESSEVASNPVPEPKVEVQPEPISESRPSGYEAANDRNEEVVTPKRQVVREPEPEREAYKAPTPKHQVEKSAYTPPKDNDNRKTPVVESKPNPSWNDNSDSKPAPKPKVEYTPRNIPEPEPEREAYKAPTPKRQETSYKTDNDTPERKAQRIEQAIKPRQVEPQKAAYEDPEPKPIPRKIETATKVYPVEKNTQKSVTQNIASTKFNKNEVLVASAGQSDVNPILPANTNQEKIAVRSIIQPESKQVEAIKQEFETSSRYTTSQNQLRFKLFANNAKIISDKYNSGQDLTKYEEKAQGDLVGKALIAKYVAEGGKTPTDQEISEALAESNTQIVKDGVENALGLRERTSIASKLAPVGKTVEGAPLVTNSNAARLVQPSNSIWNAGKVALVGESKTPVAVAYTRNLNFEPGDNRTEILNRPYTTFDVAQIKLNNGQVINLNSKNSLDIVPFLKEQKIPISSVKSVNFAKVESVPTVNDLNDPKAKAFLNGKLPEVKTTTNIEVPTSIKIDKEIVIAKNELLRLGMDPSEIDQDIPKTREFARQVYKINDIDELEKIRKNYISDYQQLSETFKSQYQNGQISKTEYERYIKLAKFGEAQTNRFFNTRKSELINYSIKNKLGNIGIPTTGVMTTEGRFYGGNNVDNILSNSSLTNTQKLVRPNTLEKNEWQKQQGIIQSGGVVDGSSLSKISQARQLLNQSNSNSVPAGRLGGGGEINSNSSALTPEQIRNLSADPNIPNERKLTIIDQNTTALQKEKLTLQTQLRQADITGNYTKGDRLANQLNQNTQKLNSWGEARQETQNRDFSSVLKVGQPGQWLNNQDGPEKSNVGLSDDGKNLVRWNGKEVVTIGPVNDPEALSTARKFYESETANQTVAPTVRAGERSVNQAGIGRVENNPSTGDLSQTDYSKNAITPGSQLGMFVDGKSVNYAVGNVIKVQNPSVSTLDQTPLSKGFHIVQVTNPENKIVNITIKVDENGKVTPTSRQNVAEALNNNPNSSLRIGEINRNTAISPVQPIDPNAPLRILNNTNVTAGSNIAKSISNGDLNKVAGIAGWDKVANTINASLGEQRAVPVSLKDLSNGKTFDANTLNNTKVSGLTLAQWKDLMEKRPELRSSIQNSNTTLNPEAIQVGASSKVSLDIPGMLLGVLSGKISISVKGKETLDTSVLTNYELQSSQRSKIDINSLSLEVKNVPKAGTRTEFTQSGLPVRFDFTDKGITKATLEINREGRSFAKIVITDPKVLEQLTTGKAKGVEVLNQIIKDNPAGAFVEFSSGKNIRVDSAEKLESILNGDINTDPNYLSNQSVKSLKFDNTSKEIPKVEVNGLNFAKVAGENMSRLGEVRDEKGNLQLDTRRISSDIINTRTLGLYLQVLQNADAGTQKQMLQGLNAYRQNLDLYGVNKSPNNPEIKAWASISMAINNLPADVRDRFGKELRNGQITEDTLNSVRNSIVKIDNTKPIEEALRGQQNKEFESYKNIILRNPIPNGWRLDKLNPQQQRYLIEQAQQRGDDLSVRELQRIKTTGQDDLSRLVGSTSPETTTKKISGGENVTIYGENVNKADTDLRLKTVNEKAIANSTTKNRLYGFIDTGKNNAATISQVLFAVQQVVLPVSFSYGSSTRTGQSGVIDFGGGIETGVANKAETAVAYAVTQDGTVLEKVGNMMRRGVDASGNGLSFNEAVQRVGLDLQKNATTVIREGKTVYRYKVGNQEIYTEKPISVDDFVQMTRQIAVNAEEIGAAVKTRTGLTPHIGIKILVDSNIEAYSSDQVKSQMVAELGSQAGAEAQRVTDNVFNALKGVKGYKVSAERYREISSSREYSKFNNVEQLGFSPNNKVVLAGKFFKDGGDYTNKFGAGFYLKNGDLKRFYNGEMVPIYFAGCHGNEGFMQLPRVQMSGSGETSASVNTQTSTLDLRGRLGSGTTYEKERHLGIGFTPPKPNEKPPEKPPETPQKEPPKLGTQTRTKSLPNGQQPVVGPRPTQTIPPNNGLNTINRPIPGSIQPGTGVIPQGGQLPTTGVNVINQSIPASITPVS